MAPRKQAHTTTATPITAGSKSASPTVLGTVGFKSMVIAGLSPPVPEPAVMEGVHHRVRQPLVMCTHHRRFVSGTVGEDLFPIKKNIFI